MPMTTDYISRDYQNPWRRVYVSQAVVYFIFYFYFQRHSRGSRAEVDFIFLNFQKSLVPSPLRYQEKIPWEGEFTFTSDSWAGLIASWGSFYPMNRFLMNETPRTYQRLQTISSSMFLSPFPNAIRRLCKRFHKVVSVDISFVSGFFFLVSHIFPPPLQSSLQFNF